MEKISSSEGIDIYKRKNETLQFCGEKVTIIEYYFYQDRFMGVYINFEGYFRFSAIKNSMFHTYGPGKKRDYFLNDYRWLKRPLLITLNYTARTNTGFIIYCYLPLWNKK
ncbi:MAG: hypothetical protein J7M06_00680 [Proteobacteria bacterium]|nr:hypothetical protein [Pseudomonadota bacterium]